MKVSIIVPVRDGERLLAPALRSLLEQRRPPDEIVVADDGSADGSAALAETLGARVLRLPRRGPAAARNAAVAASTGELIGFLDADDLATPVRLSLQTAALADPAYDVVIGHQQRFHAPARYEAPRPGWHVGALLMRRAAFTPFDESLDGGETVEWLSRLPRSRLRVLDEVVLLRRVHDANTTRTDLAWRASYVEIARRAIARHRAPT